MRCNTPFITVDELKTSSLGYDFTVFTQGELEAYISVAQYMIEKYCNRFFGNGVFTEKNETMVDREGQMLIETKNKPIAEVLELSVINTQTNYREELDVSKIELFAYEGFGKYNRSVQTPRVIYEIKYKVTEGVPNIIQQAVIMLVGNILKDEYSKNKGGSANPGGIIKKFTSGKYSEEYFDVTESMGTQSSSNNHYFTPVLQAMLDPFKTVNQNYF